MRLVIQRVREASVSIDGKEISRIGQGLLIFLGIGMEDTGKEVEYWARKVVNLRIFSDENDKMNLSVLDIKGSLLVVSQFTLYGEIDSGARPSFSSAARPEQAIPLYEDFVARCRAAGAPTETGEFGAMMQVALVNDGPVTIIGNT